jgi:hypothetical protein
LITVLKDGVKLLVRVAIAAAAGHSLIMASTASASSPS